MPPQPNQQKAPNQAPPAEGGQKPVRKIEGFDPKEFAKSLAGEASQLVPAKLQEAEKKFLIELVYKFCFLCGDALVKDEKFNLNAAQASTITQFIGEWTFHKTIDLINGGIPPELRESVLQKVAFTVFEIAKQAVSRNLPTDKTVEVIEIQVNKSFKQAINDLQSKGRIDEKIANNTMSQSHVDDMAKEESGKESNLGDDLSDTQIFKLASLALLVKKLPEDKAKNLVSKFNKSEAQVLLQYLKMPDLETKIDQTMMIRCLDEIKGVLPKPKVISMDRIYSKLFKIVKTCDKNEISNIIDNERPLIRQFVMSPYTKEDVRVPVRIGSTICKYLEDKISEEQ